MFIISYLQDILLLRFSAEKEEGRRKEEGIRPRAIGATEGGPGVSLVETPEVLDKNTFDKNFGL